MKKFLIVALAAAAWGCGQDIAYHPAPQILPSNIKKVAIRLVVNKTQQFGLEDKFTLAIRDQALRSGQYPIVPEDDADGIVQVTIQRYVLTPVQYNATLIPTAYKLRVIIDLTFVDRNTNQVLWEEKNMEGIQTYPASTVPGGLTEEQAREQIWDSLSRDVVTRVVQGFGAVTGTSQRRVTGDAPSTAPSVQTEKPIAPVNQNPY
jgi:hypothetical protein